MATTLALRTGKRVSHYDIGDRIGCGGMGEVYRARDVRLGRQVALKFLHTVGSAEARERLLREARAASLLDHPNICTIFEVDETDAGDVFLAMGFYAGETLDQVIDRGALPLARAIGIAVQAGRGLAAAHEELVVHQDVKPGNLLLTRGDTVKILDFGIATSLSDGQIDDAGFVFGTPAYMSPEQLTRARVDQRTDVWSLGVVLYEAITGSPPFRGDTVADIVDAVLRAPLPWASATRPDVPPALDRVLARAIARDVSLRYDRIDAFVSDLMQVLSTVDSTAVTARRATEPAQASIAVLPFEDLSEARDQGFLCDGLAEEVLRTLGRVPGLSVASRTSAFQYRHQTTDIREIGARLNVATVLEGSVRRIGDRLRLWVQLVSVDNGYRLWCERFDRRIEDLFAIEDEIAERIADALEVTFAGRADTPRAPQPDAEAYELYLQGRQFFHQHRRKALETALTVYERAIEVSPGYARAYAGIADCHAFLRLYFGRGVDAVAAADEASARALDLAPELAEAQAARGLALYLRGDLPGAEQHLRKAMEADPRLYEPRYIFARVCFASGRMDEAAAAFREALSIVPEAYDSWYLLGMTYRRLGDVERARHASFECIEAAKRFLRVHPDDTRAWTMGAAVFAAVGEPDRAVTWLDRALVVDADEPIIRYNAACVFVALGRHDEALSCLEAAFHEGSLAIDWARHDPDLDPLRTDPRFARLIGASPADA